MEQLIKGRSRGIMFTLVTVVIVVLLLGEVLTYLYTNTQYSSLGIQEAPSLAASSAYSQIAAAMPSFLQASLTDAVYALGAYEASGATHAVGSGAYALQSLMTNGTIYGTSMANQMGGYTLISYANSLSADGTGKGLSIILSNANIVVYPQAAGLIGSSMSAMLNVSSPYGEVAYPVSANASIPIAGLPDPFAGGTASTYTSHGANAVNNSYVPLIGGSTSLKGNAIANQIMATSASLSNYLFAQGPLFIDNSVAASCSDSRISVATNKSAYILVTPNAVAVNAVLCGFSGLVTYQANTVAPPTKPYLIYNTIKSSNVIGYLRAGGSYLLGGNSLSLYDISGLQSAEYINSYLSSGFAPSYLDLLGETYGYVSPYGVVPFSAVEQVAPALSPTSNIVFSSIPVNSMAGGINTVSFWFQRSNMPYEEAIMSSGTYTIYMLGNAIGFGTVGSNTLLGTPIYLPGKFAETPWINIVAEFYNGVPTPSSGLIMYIDGVQQNLQQITGALPVSSIGSAFTVGGVTSYATGAYTAFNGSVANLQVYNAPLIPYQAHMLYASGISSAPINGSSLAGWWPLNGNANDYSEYQNNGIAYGNVPFTGLLGYGGDSLDGGSFYHTTMYAVQGLSECYGIAACSWNGAGKVYVPVQQSFVDQQQQAGSSLGLSNNTVPGSAYFNGVQNDTLVSTYMPFNNMGAGYNTVSFWMDWTPGGYGAPFWFGNFGLAGDSNCFGFAAGNTIHGVNSLLVSNRWVNIVATLSNNGNPDGGSIYVNGTPQALTCGSPLSGASTAGSNAVIGGRPGGSWPFSGSLSDLQIYNVSLTSQNAIALYLNNTVPGGLQPAAWWLLGTGNNGFTNQTFAMTGNVAYEYLGSDLCTEANSLGFGSSCGVVFLPFGPR